MVRENKLETLRVPVGSRGPLLKPKISKKRKNGPRE